jgi:hypothetical protein
MLGDLTEIAKKVQQYRFKAASKRGDRKLPKIRTEYAVLPFCAFSQLPRRRAGNRTLPVC